MQVGRVDRQTTQATPVTHSLTQHEPSQAYTKYDRHSHYLLLSPTPTLSNSDPEITIDLSSLSLSLSLSFSTGKPFVKDAAQAKLMASETATFAAHQAIQILGDPPPPLPLSPPSHTQKKL